MVLKNFHELAEQRKIPLQQAHKELLSKGVEFMHIHIPEVNGIFRSKIAPIKLAYSGDAVNAILYCFSHSDGAPLGDITFNAPIACDQNGYPNIMGLPDPATLRHHPWNPRFASLIMNAFYLNGAACPLDPRAILAQQEERARELGFEPKFALEYEFGIFVADYDLMRAMRFRELVPWGYSLINYDVLRSRGYQDFVAELATRLAGIDVGLASFVTEYGYGMYEAALPPKSPLTAADDAMRFKFHLRELCAEHAMVATFMTRFQPPKKESACGAHHHVSLWRDGKNILAAGTNQLSEAGRHFLSGVLGRLPDTHLVFRPTINSYRRFDRQTWSPEDVSWGYENRMAAVRVITTPNADAARLEHRVAGADINPYLTIAAILAAGLDGIEQSLPLPPAAPGNPAGLGLPPLFRTLGESIAAFRTSAFVEQVFGPDFKSHYIASRENEQIAFNDWLSGHITDFEWQRYFIGT
jgi:glutamine synthetase